MVVIQVSPKDIDPEAVELEKKNLTAAIVEKKTQADALPETPADDESEEVSKLRLMRLLKSVIFQDFDGMSVAPENLDSDVRYGADSIFETVMGLQFRVSANSFFQVNSYGAECLLQVFFFFF